jgi:hypothetical protein
MMIAATRDGLHDLDTGEVTLAGRDVSFVARRGDEWWALAERGRAVLHRDGARWDGGARWDDVARLDDEAALVCHPTGPGELLVGTVGAHMRRVGAAGVSVLDAFDRVPGRADWYNPAARGRPDVWSFAGDGESVFASVHVGGLWRSRDRGETWAQLLHHEVDVHQVAAAPGCLTVAAQGGFGVSDDAGDTWAWTTDGLHAPYLQSVALTDEAVFVGASSGPFATDAAVYRAAPPGDAFERRASGLPTELEAIGPYHLAADGDRLAAVRWGSGEVLESRDGGRSWAPRPVELPAVHSLAVV